MNLTCMSHFSTSSLYNIQLDYYLMDKVCILQLHFHWCEGKVMFLPVDVRLLAN